MLSKKIYKRLKNSALEGVGGVMDKRFATDIQRPKGPYLRMTRSEILNHTLILHIMEVRIKDHSRVILTPAFLTWIIGTEKL